LIRIEIESIFIEIGLIFAFEPGPIFGGSYTHMLFETLTEVGNIPETDEPGNVFEVLTIGYQILGLIEADRNDITMKGLRSLLYKARLYFLYGQLEHFGKTLSGVF
jgi:hypothetical protein